MSDKKISLLNANTWIRAAYMLLFGLLLVAARLVVSLVVLVQFLSVLLVGADNQNLRNLGQGLGKWVYQTLMFLTFNSEEKPFPFDEWPAVDTSEGYSAKPTEDVAEGELVDAEEVVNDDIPSFTAEQSNKDDDGSKTAN